MPKLHQFSPKSHGVAEFSGHASPGAEASISLASATDRLLHWSLRNRLKVTHVQGNYQCKAVPTSHHEVHLLLADAAQTGTGPMQQASGCLGRLAMAGSCQGSCLPEHLPAKLALCFCHLHASPHRTPTLVTHSMYGHVLYRHYHFLDRHASCPSQCGSHGRSVDAHGMISPMQRLQKDRMPFMTHSGSAIAKVHALANLLHVWLRRTSSIAKAVSLDLSCQADTAEEAAEMC